VTVAIESREMLGRIIISHPKRGGGLEEQMVAHPSRRPAAHGGNYHQRGAFKTERPSHREIESADTTVTLKDLTPKTFVKRGKRPTGAIPLGSHMIGNTANPPDCPNNVANWGEKMRIVKRAKSKSKDTPRSVE